MPESKSGFFRNLFIQFLIGNPYSAFIDPYESEVVFHHPLKGNLLDS